MNILDVEFIPAPRKTFNNREWKKIRQCMSDGFFVTEREEGTITLEKKPKVFITIALDDGEMKKIEFLNRLHEFYGKELQVTQLCENFENDLKNGNVQVVNSEYGFQVASVENA